MSENGGPFKKGDPRINRKGRPKTFDALRELAQQIAHEEAKAGGVPLLINGHIVTVAEAIIRQWATSKDARLQMHFIEIAYGKVPDKLEVSGPDRGPIPIEGVDYRSVAADLAPGSIPDSDTPSQNQDTHDGKTLG